jgi:hypothetical protein
MSMHRHLLLRCCLEYESALTLEDVENTEIQKLNLLLEDS